MALMPCEIHSALLGAVFDKIPLQGQYLELHETGHAPSLMVCSMVCSQKRLTTSPCQAFVFDPSTNTCQFYSASVNIVIASSLQVFTYQITDTFHAVAIGDEQFFVYVSPQRKSFSDARAHCNEVGGYLLQFDSLAEYDAIKAVIYGHAEHYYVGATDQDLEGVWVTAKDGTPLEDAVWVWMDNNPDNYAGWENCAIFVSSAGVADVPCTNTYHCLCEKDMI